MLSKASSAGASLTIHTLMCTDHDMGIISQFRRAGKKSENGILFLSS
jgi:hypothetical protein